MNASELTRTQVTNLITNVISRGKRKPPDLAPDVEPDEEPEAGNRQHGRSGLGLRGEDNRRRKH